PGVAGAVLPRALLRVSPPRGPRRSRGAVPDASPRAPPGTGSLGGPGRRRGPRRDACRGQGNVTALEGRRVRAGRALAGRRRGAGQRRGGWRGATSGE